MDENQQGAKTYFDTSSSQDKSLEDIYIENAGLVHMAARRFMGRGVEYDDLVQLGAIGLIKAARRFEPERGFAFSTYAVPLIIGEIRRFFRDDSPIRISRSLKENGLRLKKLEEAFLLREGRSPSVSELCSLSGLEEEVVVETLSALLPAVSLDAPVDAKGEGSLLDLISHRDDLKDTAERLDMHQGLQNLQEGDRKLILLRYFKGLTQAETGRLLGLSQVQVSRSEKRILTRLRAFMLG